MRHHTVQFTHVTYVTVSSSSPFRPPAERTDSSPPVSGVSESSTVKKI
jgi:hypothetical protein